MEKNKYDLVICYRIYPKISKTPAVFPDDKYKLSELCFKSLVSSIAGKLKVKFYVILDACPEEYKDIFLSNFDSSSMEFIETKAVGNALTFKKQIDILLSQNESEFIMFAEDDYFYLPNCFYELTEFIKNYDDVDFLSVYDHLDYYTNKIQESKSQFRIHNNRYWRTVPATCMTFITRKETLKKAKRVLLTYTKKNYDASIWLVLTKKNICNIPLFSQSLFKDSLNLKILLKVWIYTPFYALFGKKFKLWSPMPTIGTHIDSSFLSPLVNWEEYFYNKSDK
ncbi:MAG: glycosyltransferase family 2 protein [Ignavibacteria bacterium]|nr:glycosyltransferase family 2 protein [Ignavibacteria bacterium]